jgi:hypothetical protein
MQHCLLGHHTKPVYSPIVVVIGRTVSSVVVRVFADETMGNDGGFAQWSGKAMGSLGSSSRLHVFRSPSTTAICVLHGTACLYLIHIDPNIK